MRSQKHTCAPKETSTQRHRRAENNLFTPRAGQALAHRHLLDLFPLTWGRHLAIRSPPSLYQQEGALRRCCSSEPVRLDTNHCRESLSFTPAGRREKKKKIKITQQFSQNSSAAASAPTFCLAGQEDENVCVYVCGRAEEQHILQEQAQDTTPQRAARLDRLLERWLKH